MHFDAVDPGTPYQKSAEEMAYFKTSSAYGNLEPPNNDEISAFKQLKEDVESNNDTNAQKIFNLAWHYEHGIDSELSNIMYGQRYPDYKKAIQLYKKSYKKKFGLAAHQIGILYEKGGYGIKQNYLKASEWYLKDIEITGDRKTVSSYRDNTSYLTIARLYIEGLGVEENHVKAVEILSSLKFTGHPTVPFPKFTKEIINNKAQMYYMFSQIYTDYPDGGIFGRTYGCGHWNSKEDGYLISNDAREALWEKWLKKALEINYAPALFDYAQHLNDSRCLDLDRGKPEYIEEKMKSLKDSMRSLYYYKQSHKFGYELALDYYNETLNNIVNEVSKAYTIVLESKKN